MTINVCVAGATGWTGRAIAAAVHEAPDLTLRTAVSRSAAGTDLGAAWGGSPIDVPVHADVADALDGVDVLVDYTSHLAVLDHALTAVNHGVAVVIGTSGLTSDDFAQIDAAAERAGIGVIAAGNFSLTAALAQAAALLVAPHLPQREIIDYASAGKKDAPSGTARELAERLAEINRPNRPCPSPTPQATPTPAAPRLQAPRCTRCGCPASWSPPRSSSPYRTNASPSVTTQGRRRRPTSRAPCWPSAPSDTAVASSAVSTPCSSHRELPTTCRLKGRRGRNRGTISASTSCRRHAGSFGDRGTSARVERDDQASPLPLVVAVGEIRAHVAATGLTASSCGREHGLGEKGEGRALHACAVYGGREDGGCLGRVGGGSQPRSVPADAGVGGHRALYDSPVGNGDDPGRGATGSRRAALGRYGPGDPGADHETLQQAVGREPVRAVQAGARHLTGGVETRHGRAAVHIGDAAAASVVRRGTYRDRVAHRVDPITAHAACTVGKRVAKPSIPVASSQTQSLPVSDIRRVMAAATTSLGARSASWCAPAMKAHGRAAARLHRAPLR